MSVSFYRELGGVETKRLMQAHQPLTWMNDTICIKGMLKYHAIQSPEKFNGILNVTVLCWTVFRAILGHGGKQPMGHRLDTPDKRLFEEKKKSH